MLKALESPILLVRDLERASLTYAALLGRPPEGPFALPDYAAESCVFGLANTQIKLLAPKGSGSIADGLRARLDRVGEGPLALVFATPNVERFSKQLMERGVETAPEPSVPGRPRWLRLPKETARGVSLVTLERRGERTEAAPVVAGSAVEALDQVVVMSPDLEGSRAVYGDILGLRLALDRSFESRGTRILFFRVGGVTIEVGGRLDATAKPEDPDRLWGLGYRVRDLELTRERLLARGFELSEIRKGAKRGTRVCTVRQETHGTPTLLIDSDPQTSAL